jgi:hypothetical protein
MKKAMNSSAGTRESVGMLPEYNLTGKEGVRGKYYRPYSQGHTVRIHRDDGTVSVQRSASQEQL